MATLSPPRPSVRRPIHRLPAWRRAWLRGLRRVPVSTLEMFQFLLQCHDIARVFPRWQREGAPPDNQMGPRSRRLFGYFLDTEAAALRDGVDAKALLGFFLIDVKRERRQRRRLGRQSAWPAFAQQSRRLKHRYGSKLHTYRRVA